MKEEILTILTAAAPISEIRGAIPLAIGVFGFAPLKAYLLSIVGNLLPAIPLLAILYYASDFLMHRVYFINRFLTWLFDYTRERHAAHFEKHHHHHWRDWLLTLALFVFVAIPFPLTGAWSGAVAAFVFGIPFWRSVLAISLGVAVAGAIVLGVTMGVLTSFGSVL